MTRDTGDKRQQILAAATRIFAAQGYHQAKIADIAAAAGVGKGTVYEYFRSKKELFQQLLLQLVNSYLDYFQKLCRQEMALEEFIQRLLRDSLDHFQAYQGIVRIIFNDHPPVDAATQGLLQAIHREKLRCLSTYLQAALERGEMRPVSPWLAATMLSGFLANLGHQLMWEKLQASLEDNVLEAKIEEVKEIILHGLAG